MIIRNTRIAAALGLSLVLPVMSAQAAPVLLAEVTTSSSIAWVDAVGPAPGTVQFSYRIRTNPGLVTTEYLTSTADASTPVPITFDLSGPALTATIAALQDGVIHDYQFWSTGPDRYNGTGPLQTVSQIFDSFDLPDLTAATIGGVRISLFQVCARRAGEACAAPFSPNLPNEISARVRMSVFGPDVTVPEPGTMALLVAGLSGLAFVRRRERGR